jgi:hypothetical protein
VRLGRKTGARTATRAVRASIWPVGLAGSGGSTSKGAVGAGVGVGAGARAGVGRVGRAGRVEAVEAAPVGTTGAVVAVSNNILRSVSVSYGSVRGDI